MVRNHVISDGEEDEVHVEEEERDEVPEDGEDVDEDDDEEVQDEFEKDGFIVDEEEDEEDRADSDEERHKKRKKKKRDSERHYELDDDDYELLQESNITVNRPKQGSKTFKRLKKAQRDSEEQLSGFPVEDDLYVSGHVVRTDEEKVKYTLLGNDDGQPLEDVAEEKPDEEEEDAVIGEDDETDDFIFDGMGPYGETVRVIDVFDPIIISKKYMTEDDERIRETDIPERMQLSEGSTCSPTDEMDISEETNWIYNQLRFVSPFNKREMGLSEEGELPIDKDDIMRFLDLMHVQKLDIPFIAMYRKEECMTLLKEPDGGEVDVLENSYDKKPGLKWHKVLWTIQDLDRKWLLLRKRKSALQSYYSKQFEEESRRLYDETRLNLNKDLFESISKSLKASGSEREMDDVDLKFNLHFPPGEIGVDEGQFKRPVRKSAYSYYRKAGLWEVVNKFGYSSEQFGLLISLEKNRMDELEDPKETPEEMASNYICRMLETPQKVLKGARHMAAVEINCEPSVRKYVRSVYMMDAVVSTSPTPDGNTAIGPFHQFAGVKWLKDKPLSKFDDAQWILIQKAEEEKLLQVSITLPQTVLYKLTSDSNEYYLSDGVSKSSQLWNEQRKLILEDAVNNMLLPSMEKEARLMLSSRAKNWLLSEYGQLLWNKVSVGPYQRRENGDSSDECATPRVMACCWGPGNPETTFVMLDSSGEVLDMLYARSLSLRGLNVNDEQRKNDQKRLLKFMMDHKPHVVIIGAANLCCTRLKEGIYEIIFMMVEDNPRDVGEEMDNLNVVYGDESLPRLYENCQVSRDQFPCMSGIVRRAVALGRYHQNPLAMVASLCGPRREILSWKLSSMENFLTPEEKYGMIEQIMVDATNQVGLDLNLAISHEWLFAPLQFISGLGPRKAASLQRSLVRQQTIFTRKYLLTEHHLGKKVFINVLGFLRVRRSGYASNSNTFMDLLDDTRIHPESYSLAQELAKDVYLKDVGEDNKADDDEVLEAAIQHVRENPKLLESVDPYKYADAKQRISKKETLKDIRLELMHGFQDWRRPYVEPNQDEEFYMISGETEETLFEGISLQATVRRVQPKKVLCALESGLVGIVMKEEDLPDAWKDIDDLTETVHPGEVLPCRVKSIKKNRYLVFLSCKDNDMRRNRFPNNMIMDDFYCENHSNLQTEQEKAGKEKELTKKHFKPRMIVHPRFQNITADEAMQFLSAKEPGESIIHPSSRGLSFLTLTLKVYDDVYAHKDIVEGGKEHKKITSLLRIGKTLKIGDDTFDDLDEVMDRYVDPLVAHLKAMLNYRKFKKGTKAEVDELLRLEKSENPMSIAYSFGISHDHPGTFILTYIRSSNPHHECVGLYPKGFKFRKRMFAGLSRLVAYFQRHINDPPGAAPSIQ